MFGFGQMNFKTYVPDDNFETYLENNGMGDGVLLNDSINTLSIEMLMYLDVSNQNISDLTGIEDFIVIQDLNAHGNQLTYINLGQNTSLVYLDLESNSITSLDLSSNISVETIKCRDNNLTTINISNNSQLVYLDCDNNQITNLSTINNLNLEELYCSNNQITHLDLSSNNSLTELNAAFNLLISLNVKNGNNQNISDFYSTWNPDLNCIDVDDPIYSSTNWIVSLGMIDPQHFFSNDCSSVPYDCTDSLEVTDVIIDNANLTMNIAIYNGYNSYLSMPYVAFTIDANGDTIQFGDMNLFGAINLDTSWYNYSINSAINPSSPLTMYFVYAVSIGGSVLDTCILTYNSTPTVITDINLMDDRKLISIIDVLGRETKGTKNQPLFYIYNDGTVEKRIIIE